MQVSHAVRVKASLIMFGIRLSLAQKLILSLIGVLALTSLFFLALFVERYEDRLMHDRGETSAQVNRLLQTSLENAMLKRDLEGLRGIVTRMGTQDRIVDVMIVNPQGEIRFASNTEKLGQAFDVAPALSRTRVDESAASADMTSFVRNSEGVEVLRSINPVLNKSSCVTCHGPLQANPINGVLVVDYDAAGLKTTALMNALALSGSGLLVMVVAVISIWAVLARYVLRPVRQLSVASQALAAKNLSARVDLAGRDELGDLGRTFNHMAEHLERSMTALEERQSFLQGVIDSVPDGLRVIDQDYRVVQANAAFCRQIGRSREEIVGEPCYASSHARSEPCAATLICCPLQEFKTNDGPLVFRDHHHGACGDATPVEVAAAQFISGNRTLVVEVIRDLAQEIKFSQEQKLSELGLLAAGVAHEIRNPLSSIHFSINAIGKVLEHNATKDALNDMLIINKEIDRCIDVTDRLLKLTIADTARNDLLEIDRLVHEVMSLLRYEATQLGISVEIDIDHGLRLVGSDGDMRMIVLNLAQNAMHALQRGGQFKITGRSLERSIELTFEDNGVGIPPEDLPYVFHPFWSRRADDVRGTGLGLSICKAIVKSHGGDISVTSELGRGTRFLVTLPNADTKETAA